MPPRRRSLAPIASSPKNCTPTPIPASEEKFKEVSVAYDVLGDQEKRKEYDEVRRLGRGRGRLSASGPGAGAGRLQLPDRRPRGPRATSSAVCSACSVASAPRAALTWRPALHLGFRDAVKGVTTTVNLPSATTPVHACGGSGAAPGTGFGGVPNAVRVAACLNDDQGPFAMSSVCSGLSGSRRTDRDAVSDLSRERAESRRRVKRERAIARGRGRRPAHSC